MGPPATHADNPMLVWQQRTGSYWQLFASTSPRGRAVQLSFGDCNAYDPSWENATTAIYVSDCGRGTGLGALAEINVEAAAGIDNPSPASEANEAELQGASKQ
jgi:hypothetical protein